MGSEVRLRSITITGFRRPYAFRAMLGSLLANDLAGWRILIQVEPSPVAEDFAAITTELLAGHDHELVFNASRLGIDENPLRLIERAFAEGSELNLYLEEDLLLAPDVTRLASWFEQNHRPDWLCLSLISGGCASAGLLSNADYPALLFAGRNFNSLGFAVRRAECRQPAAVDVGQRDLELAAKDRLVHEQEVTDEQGVFHARRGDAEGFDQKRPQHNPDQQGRSDRLQPGDRLFPRGFARRSWRRGGGWWR